MTTMPNAVTLKEAEMILRLGGRVRIIYATNISKNRLNREDLILIGHDDAPRQLKQIVRAIKKGKAVLIALIAL
jgi:hypothetical protein